MRVLWLGLLLGCGGGTDNRLEPWALPLQDAPTLSSMEILGSIVDAERRVWVLGGDGVLLRAGPAREQVRRYDLDLGYALTLGFRGMKIGSQGVELWFGGRGDEPWIRFLYQDRTDQFLKDESIKSIGVCPPEDAGCVPGLYAQDSKDGAKFAVTPPEKPAAPVRVPASCSVSLDLKSGELGAEETGGGGRLSLSLAPGWSDIRGLAATPEEVWLATDRGPMDINRVTGETGAHAGPCVAVQNLCVDGDETVWAASGTTLLSRVADGTWKTWARVLPDDLLGSAASIRKLVCNAPDGRIWLGTEDGFVAVDRRTGRLIQEAKLALDADSHERLTTLLPWPDGTVWVGTTKGLRRYRGEAEIDKGNTNLSLYVLGSVETLLRDGSGALWVGSSQGLLQYKPGGFARWMYKTDLLGAMRDWRSSSKWKGNDQNVADSVVERGPGPSDSPYARATSNLYISDAALESGGALWLASPTGSYRYDPLLDPRGEAFSEAGFSGLYGGHSANAVTIAPTGEVWLALHDLLFRVSRTSRSLENPTFRSTIIAAGETPFASVLSEGGPLWIPRQGAILAVAQDRDSPQVRATRLDVIPRGASLTAVAPGPLGGVWTGTALGAISLRAVGRTNLLATAADGLPAASTEQISSVPGTPGSAWVLTGLGLLRLSAEGTPGAWPDRITPKSWIPIDALANGSSDPTARRVLALPDGSAVFAWSRAEGAVDEGSGDGSAFSRLRRVSTDGVLGPIFDLPQDRQTLSLAWQGATMAAGRVWIGTSAGLYRWERPQGSDTSPVFVNAGGKLPASSIRELAVDPRGTVWLSSDAGVVGYDPRQEEIRVVENEEGAQPGGALWLDPQGNLVVQSGDQFWRGKVYVPVTRVPLYVLLSVAVGLAAGLALVRARRRDPVVETARLDPATLRELPLRTLVSVLDGLRKIRALDPVLKALDLPAGRFADLAGLAGDPSPEALAALSQLLGASSTGALVDLGPGLWLLPARLPEPSALAKVDTPLVALDPLVAFPAGEEAVQGDPISAATQALQGGLEKVGRQASLPFVVLCPDATAARKIASDPGMLVLSEAELRTLLFARSPAQAFTGLLLARRALHIRPYSAVGHVASAEMFFGRSELRRALAADARAIVVGPRRVGKTSLLRRVEADLRGRTGEVEAIFLDIMGVVDVAALGQRWSEALGEPTLAGHSDPASLLRALQAVLPTRRARLSLLMDEADGIVLADQEAGWPLLWGLRSVVAEGRISVTLAGYLHLFRGALDQASPLYNFGAIHRLGPLERPAAVALVTEPMSRVGIRYADPALVDQIVDQTGGFPNLLQELCAGLIEALGEDPALTITAAHLDEASQALALKRLEDFHYNTSAAGRLLVYAVLERPGFTLVEARTALEKLSARKVPAAVLEGLLQELELRGVVARERADRPWAWAVPLLVAALRQDSTPAAEMAEMLLGELGEDPESWGVAGG